MFREFQNRINFLSRRLSDVQDMINELIAARGEIERNPCGPRGNCFDSEANGRITTALSDLYAEQDALSAELSDVRLQLNAAMSMRAAA